MQTSNPTNAKDLCENFLRTTRELIEHASGLIQVIEAGDMEEGYVIQNSNTPVLLIRFAGVDTTKEVYIDPRPANAINATVFDDLELAMRKARAVKNAAGDRFIVVPRVDALRTCVANWETLIATVQEQNRV